MCIKNSHMIRGRKKPRKASTRLVPSSMSKPKARKKPKYLSLKLQLSTPTSRKKNKAELLQDKEEAANDQKLVTKLKDHNFVDLLQDDHVAFLFETATDGVSTTLDGLLDSSTAAATSDPLSPSLSCVQYSYQLPSDLRGGSLLRAAMRSKEREGSEERWVSYNEVVEGRSSKKEQEEVTSCCGVEKDHDEQVQLVGLKLDNFQEILDAWSNKDPFCLGIHAGGGDDLSNPQLVPELHGASSVWLEGWRSNVANLWKVPELMDADIRSREKDKEEEEGSKWEHREASMLRYKKKRQSRLFAKRIRYEVRKLNAEKRPRIKGRFVKRCEENIELPERMYQKFGHHLINSKPRG